MLSCPASRPVAIVPRRPRSRAPVPCGQGCRGLGSAERPQVPAAPAHRAAPAPPFLRQLGQGNTTSKNAPFGTPRSLQSPAIPRFASVLSVGLTARCGSQVPGAPAYHSAPRVRALGPRPPTATHARPCALPHPGTQGDLNRTQNWPQPRPRHVPLARLAGQHPLEDARQEGSLTDMDHVQTITARSGTPCSTGCVWGRGGQSGHQLRGR